MLTGLEDWVEKEKHLEVFPIPILQDHLDKTENFKRESEPGKWLVGVALHFTMGAINVLVEKEGSVELKKLKMSKEEEWMEAKTKGSNAEGTNSTLPSWLATEHELNEKDSGNTVGPNLGEASLPTGSINIKAAEGGEDEDIAKLRKRLARRLKLKKSQNV